MMEPKKLGPFQIIRQVGRGGMGAVYQAEYEETHKPVAVKVLLDQMEEDSELRSRFEAEIETLKRLRHPNIVRLFGFGQEEGLLYYAMEYVEGPSLQELLRKKRLFTWEQVLHIGIGVAQALRHAHDRGIIHRDIKPANILLLSDGQVKVSDYGIAHFFGGSRLTDANMVIGTIEYMAPEQASAGPLTPKSDIYSLGALLYALITGIPPYTARTLPEILQKYKSGPPESVRFKRPEVPAVFDLFLMELLRVQPEKRPANASLIQRRLEAIRLAFAKDQVNPFAGAGLDEKAAYYEFLRSDTPAQAPSADASRVNLERPTGSFVENDFADLKADFGATNTARTLVDGNDSKPPDPNSTCTNAADSAEEDDFELSVETGEHSESATLPADLPVTVRIGVGKASATQESTDFDLGETEPFHAPSAVSPGTAPNRVDRFAAAANRAASTPTAANPISPPSAVVPQETVKTDMLENLRPKEHPSASGANEQEKSSAESVAPTQEYRATRGASKTGLNSFDFDLTPEQELPVIERSENATRPVGDAPVTEAPRPVGAAADIPEPVYSRPLPNSRRSFRPSRAFSSFRKKTSGSNPSTVRPGTAATFSTKTSHFTMVPEDELGRFHDDEETSSSYVSMKIWIFASILLIFGVLFWYSLRSPSADQLYEKIFTKVESSEDESGYLAALRSSEKTIGQFLSLYSNDPRAEKVREYLSDLELGNLERRLERQLDRKSHDESLSAVECAYVDAIQSVKNDPNEGVKKLQAFIDLFSSEGYFADVPADSNENVPTDSPAPEQTSEQAQETPSNEGGSAPVSGPKRVRISGVEQTIPGQCVILAQRRLDKIRKELDQSQKLQKELLTSRLELADSLQESDPERSKAIRGAIELFYGDKPWAQEILHPNR